MARMPVEERRNALVRAALAVVARDGVGAATTRSIVAEAGMSLASFHYAFASRDELIDELIATVIRAEQEAVLPAVDAGTGLRETLVAGFRRYLDYLRADPGRELAMLELTWHALRSGRGELAAAQYASYRRLAAEALDAAAESSGCRWRVPVDDVARVLVAFSDGLTVDWLVHRDARSAASVIEAAADGIVALADAPAMETKEAD